MDFKRIFVIQRYKKIFRIGTIRISPLPVKKDSEESREYDGNGRLGIVSSDFKEIIEEEKGRSLERRFWVRTIHFRVFETKNYCFGVKISKKNDMFFYKENTVNLNKKPNFQFEQS